MKKAFMNLESLTRKSTPNFWGLTLVAIAVVLHAQNSRYQFTTLDGTGFYKFDTRTGDGFLCSKNINDCAPLNKDGFDAWLEKHTK